MDAGRQVAGGLDPGVAKRTLWDLVAIGGDGERRRLLPPPAATSSTLQYAPGDFYGTLSPDGRVLAFARTAGTWLYRLYTVRLTRGLKPEGKPELLVDQSYPSLKGIAWVSNRDIVYGAGAHITNARLWRVRVGSGSPALLNWAAMGSSMPAVAPAQHLLAYAAHSATGRLWRMDLRTGERRLIADSRHSQELPQYSPDGRKVAFQSDRSGQDEVWSCDAEGKADGTNCQQLTFSKDRNAAHRAGRRTAGRSRSIRGRTGVRRSM